MKAIQMLILVFITVTGMVMADEVSERYSQGMEAVEAGQFNLAVQEFERILQSGWESAPLLYNLGNAYFRENNIAGAVWAYEKCLKLDPGFQDVIYNLSLVNLKVKDRVDVPTPPIYLQFYRHLKQQFTPEVWISICSLWLVLFTLFRMVRLVKRWDHIKPLKITEHVFIILLIMSVLVGAHAINDVMRIEEGIIYSDTVTATSEPNEYSTALFQVHGGLKVTVIDQMQDWVEIRLIDDKSGWIPEKDVRLFRE